MDDLALRRLSGRAAKQLTGLVSEQQDRVKLGRPTRPRIIERRPRPGFHHPAGRQDVLQVLHCLGPVAAYGVRAVEFCQSPAQTIGALPRFGRLRVPGWILIYELPFAPWRLRGRLATRDAARLESAGAVLSVADELEVTWVDWPGDTLRKFVILDVLMHEIGHHILQHHKGKRLARIARTRDHEAFAERFVEKYRRAFDEPPRAP